MSNITDNKELGPDNSEACELIEALHNTVDTTKTKKEKMRVDLVLVKMSLVNIPLLKKFTTEKFTWFKLEIRTK